MITRSKTQITHVVIAGAGPIGLFAACGLKKAGVKDIIVLDPRANCYTRPGVIGSDAFQIAIKLLNEKYNNLPYRLIDNHIKDFERQLYKLAQKLEIPVEKSTFQNFDNHRVNFIDIEGKINSIPCDLFIDATGPKRAGVHAVNQQDSHIPFNIKNIRGNPVKTQFHAYVTVSKKQIEILRRKFNPWEKSLLENPNLFKTFGWPYDHPPYFVNFSHWGKNKISLYCDVPDGLETDQLEPWLKTVAKNYLGTPLRFKQLPPSKKYESKPRFTAFVSDPHWVTPASYSGNEFLPIVIPVGDAQIEPEYRLGVGIGNGLRRVNALIESLKINHGKIIDIDYKNYETSVGYYIEELKEEIQKFYGKHQKHLGPKIPLTVSSHRGRLFRSSPYPARHENEKGSDFPSYGPIRKTNKSFG